MIYLVASIAGYLALALALGAAAGWLWRHRQALRREEHQQQIVGDLRRRIPALEQALQERDAEVQQLRRTLEARSQQVPPSATDDPEREALEAALNEARQERDAAQVALGAERRQVEALARERALQNETLKALEAQLAMARDEPGSRAAGGGAT
ncbi:MAG: hypothetical protein ACODAC_04780 [Pseudomonadota bacterium]